MCASILWACHQDIAVMITYRDATRRVCPGKAADETTAVPIQGPGKEGKWTGPRSCGLHVHWQRHGAGMMRAYCAREEKDAGAGEQQHPS